jgi:hypothetical protein
VGIWKVEVLHPFLEYFFHENLLESLDVKQKIGAPNIFALAFYRSQNVLCQSKLFEPTKKFDCVVECLFKNFFVGTKTNLLNTNHLFCLEQNVFDWH